MALIINHGVDYDFPACARCGSTRVSLSVQNMGKESMDVTGSCCSDCGLEFTNILANGKLVSLVELRCRLDTGKLGK